MRDIDIEQECRNSGLDWSYMTHVHWSESMTGKEYARLPSWGNGPSQVSWRIQMDRAFHFVACF